MRILVLTSRLPYPPNRGDRLRVYHFIRELSRHHQITLLSFIADEIEIANLAGLRDICTDIQLIRLSAAQSRLNMATRGWRNAPLQTQYYHSAGMQAAVDSLTARTRFDLVYTHLFRMAPFVADLTGPYKVLDLTDVISAELNRAIPFLSLPRRTIYRLEAARVRQVEQQITGRFDETWVISENERRALLALGAQGNVVVVPNGVADDVFHPLGTPCDRTSLIFTGHMGVLHNVDAAEFLVEDILPLVRAEVPGATVKLVGAEPSSRVRQLADRPGVVVVGHAPDLNLALNSAAVFVAPLRFAAGVQNKVLEAMAAGTPVVTTSIVQGGIDAVDGRHLLVGDTAEAIANKVTWLLAHPAEANALAAEARAFVTATFQWEAVDRRVVQISRALLTRR